MAPLGNHLIASFDSSAAPNFRQGGRSRSVPQPVCAEFVQTVVVRPTLDATTSDAHTWWAEQREAAEPSALRATRSRTRRRSTSCATIIRPLPALRRRFAIHLTGCLTVNHGHGGRARAPPQQALRLFRRVAIPSPQARRCRTNLRGVSPPVDQRLTAPLILLHPITGSSPFRKVKLTFSTLEMRNAKRKHYWRATSILSYGSTISVPTMPASLWLGTWQ
jgi:hypothetical protein